MTKINSFEELIETKVKTAKQSAKRKKKTQDRKFQAECDLLRPLIEKLLVLKKYGLEPKLHTNKNHFPCPAIHIQKSGTLYKKLGEIFLDDNDCWVAGGCNSHRYGPFLTEEGLLTHIAEAIASREAEGK